MKTDDRLSNHPALIQWIAYSLRQSLANFLQIAPTMEDALLTSLIEDAVKLTGKTNSPQQFAREFNAATAGMSPEAKLQLAERVIELRGAPAFIKYLDENGVEQTISPNEESIRAAASLKVVDDGIKAKAEERRRAEEIQQQLLETLRGGFESWKKAQALSDSNSKVTDMTTFKVGDVVTLKTGSPLMTVKVVSESKVECVWFWFTRDDNSKEWHGPLSAWFERDTLALHNKTR